MTYRVQYYNPDAVATPHWRDLAGRRLPLPVGWAFLVNTETEIPHIETTLFLAKVAKKGARKRGDGQSGNTSNTYASELKPFLEYLQYYDIAWSDADPEVLFGYVQALSERRHWFTGAEIDGLTLERRVRRVIQAYRYTNSQNVSDVELDAEELIAELGIASNLDPKTNAYRSYQSKKRRHISDAEYELIAAELGPRPSDIAEDAEMPSSCRNRLMGDLGITTGVRGGELASLPLAPFLAVTVTEANRSAWTIVRIKGKGGRERNVFVANILVAEVQTYARRLRAKAITAAAARGFADPGTVFVAGHDAGESTGRRMRAQQLSEIFRAAVRRALPSDPITIEDEGRTFEYLPARYRLHDLRHSFAMRLFHKLVALGKDPWDILQARLGHKTVSVTRDVYLDMSRSFEPEAADLLAAGLDALINA
ncbi:site-specific integrase [Sphingomonas aliaeris]|uniref:Site-specific integrase n=1 Tax=Sphingomonas aliaeris TaxID=2759526 RepID=A0A974NW13_9SPHN|nr:site-specific integrase [Sphingomonas aliaeris]QQV77927.1 site-specific integrase [Sphingomonas aliaeris]